jgi:hypothetical protein
MQPATCAAHNVCARTRSIGERSRERSRSRSRSRRRIESYVKRHVCPRRIYEVRFVEMSSLKAACGVSRLRYESQLRARRGSTEECNEERSLFWPLLDPSLETIAKSFRSSPFLSLLSLWPALTPTREEIRDWMPTKFSSVWPSVLASRFVPRFSFLHVVDSILYSGSFYISDHFISMKSEFAVPCAENLAWNRLKTRTIVRRGIPAVSLEDEGWILSRFIIPRTTLFILWCRESN